MESDVSRVIEMAREDHTPFEAIDARGRQPGLLSDSIQTTVTPYHWQYPLGCAIMVAQHHKQAGKLVHGPV
ncbi:DUF2805 domain-containing protein [Marinobacter sp.]|uniref:DUF2805 domain-containing protein n=1 Tax=Marinobacter sp. TaxID=50741 RepID=UPI003A8E77E3